MQLYLDNDGVLAAFDKKAIEIFGMHPREFELKYGSGQFWKTINRNKNFFEELELMEDAQELYDAVKHLNPIILTGVPSNKMAKPQKERWVARMFGPNQRVICCKSAEKYLHCSQGDVLVDDWTKYKSLWESVGGIFIVHTSAKNSIEELTKLKII